MTRDRELPTWATVGATAWMAPHTYGRSNKFVKVTITRVTKTSVFVKSDNEGSNERRFVDTGWSGWGGSKEIIFQEYGHRGDAWGKPAYLYGGDSGVVESGLAASQRDDAYSKAVRTVAEFTSPNPRVSRKASATASIEALTAYLELLESQGL